MYIAMMIGAGPLIVIEAEKFGAPTSKPVVEANHVLDRVDRHAALADLADHAVGVRIDAVKRRTVKGGAETFRALMRAQEMETLVRVFREHEAGEEPRRLLLRNCFRLGAIRFRPAAPVGRLCD